MADIARAAGLSKGAVSYALNGRPGVSEATRREVTRIARELGWMPNTAARALSASKAGAVGLVLARPAHILGLEPFLMRFVAGIEAEFARRSLALVLQVVPDVRAECEVYRRWWGERRIDGVIVVDLRMDDPRLAALVDLGLPAVVVGGRREVGPGSAIVWSDETAAMRSAVAYLVDRGHPAIAHVAGPPDMWHTGSRTAAFRTACAEHGVAATVVHGDYSGDEGGRLTGRLLAGPRRPTAIVYDNDLMAIAGLAAAQERGIAVPADLSIVAWEDSALCRLVHPPLTTLTRDVPALGGMAARALLRLLDGEPAPAVPAEPATLTVRGSTGPPPGVR